MQATSLVVHGMWSCPSRLSVWPSQPMQVTCLTSNLIQLSTPRIPVPEQSVENANRGHRNRQGPYHLVHGRYVAWRHAADPPPFQLSNLVPSPKTFSLVMLIAAFIFGVAYLWQARSILPDPSDPCEPNPRDPTHPRPHAHSCMLHRRFRATPRSLQVRNASSIRGLD